MKEAVIKFNEVTNELKDNQDKKLDMILEQIKKG